MGLALAVHNGDGALKRLIRRIQQDCDGLIRDTVVSGLAGSYWLPRTVRTAIYRLFGLDVSWRSSVEPRVKIRGRRLTLGTGSTINNGCTLDCRGPIVIGQRTGIAMDVRLLTGSHSFDDPRCRAGVVHYAKIQIGDGVWIGSGATILGGVTIEDGVIIGAGAVVNRDCLRDGLYVGVPAMRKADLPG